MVETFYGPWSITIVGGQVPSHIERFTIAGSDASDGLYYPGDANPALANVSGAAWTIDLEAQIPAATVWVHFPSERSATYTTQAGLVVYLRTADKNVLTKMVLACRSLNPEHHPYPPAGAPYDFTVSREAMERYKRKSWRPRGDLAVRRRWKADRS